MEGVHVRCKATGTAGHDFTARPRREKLREYSPHGAQVEIRKKGTGR